MCKVTRVKFYEVENGSHSKFLGRCSVVLDDVIKLNDIKIFKGEKGNYLVMPKRCLEVEELSPEEGQNGSYYKDEVFHPVDSLFFKEMSSVVLEGFEKCINTGNTSYHPRR